MSSASNINIAVVGLLAISVLFGTLASLRFKILVLVPSALMIALFSAAVLHLDFGPWSGIAIVIACLILNQAAYLIVQIYSPTFALRFNKVANGIPSR
jgi:hypothetical protein